MQQGMRGITFEYLPYNFTSFDDLAMLGHTITVESTGGNRSTLQGTWETPMELYNTTAGPYCTRSVAFFQPPAGGNYVFWVAASEVAELRGTWVTVSWCGKGVASTCKGLGRWW